MTTCDTIDLFIFIVIHLVSVRNNKSLVRKHVHELFIFVSPIILKSRIHNNWPRRRYIDLFTAYGEIRYSYKHSSMENSLVN